MKRMLSVEEQIEHMKKKGITFEKVSEEEAAYFLKNNNYYMKLAAYRSNYEKCTEGRRKGQYQKLDFGCLQELSTLDMHLRYLILAMCLDIEHAVKVKIMSTVTENEKEDGYDVVRKFLAQDTGFRILKTIKSHNGGEYCRDLIQKYYPYFPVWVFLELISFGDLMHFCCFYQEEYHVKIADNKLLNIVRDTRNAAAHSNCMLSRLTERIDRTKQVSNTVTEWIKNMEGISKTSRTNNLKYQFAYSFVTLLCVYDLLIAETAKKKRYAELSAFLHGRASRHADYFEDHTKITGVYHFIQKVIDNLNG